MTARVTAIALVLIATTLLWSAISTELRYHGLGLGIGELRSSGEIEVTSEVVDTSYHFRGEPGDSEIITLGVGVWEILGASEDAPITLASVNHSQVTGWTGFRQVVTVVDADAATVNRADSAGPVLPYGPMRLSVEAERPWVVDVRRVLCPSDVHRQFG